MTVRELYRNITSCRVQIIEYDSANLEERVVFDDRDNSLNHMVDWIKYRDKEVRSIDGYFDYNDSEIIIQIDISKDLPK